MNIGARMWRFIYYHKSISFEWKLPQKLSERINAMNSCSVILLLFVLALIWAANVRQKSACSYMPNLWDFFCLFNLYLVKFVWRNCCWNKIWIDKIISVLFEKKLVSKWKLIFWLRSVIRRISLKMVSSIVSAGDVFAFPCIYFALIHSNLLVLFVIRYVEQVDYVACGVLIRSDISCLFDFYITSAQYQQRSNGICYYINLSLSMHKWVISIHMRISAYPLSTVISIKHAL